MSDGSINILLINPNSTVSFTEEISQCIKPRLPPNVKVDFYTAPPSAPSSIDGPTDGVISTATIIEDMKLRKDGTVHSSGAKRLVECYSGIIVACFSAHPLVPALREILSGLKRPPTIVGILESSIYSALQLGPRFGIVTTGTQWEPLFDEAVRSLGISASRYAGTIGIGTNATGLHSGDASNSLFQATNKLVSANKANVIILGCAGMSTMREKLQHDLYESHEQSAEVPPPPIIDGVQAAVDMSISYARMGVSRVFGTKPPIS